MKAICDVLINPEKRKKVKGLDKGPFFCTWILMTIKLRPYQSETVTAVMHDLAAGHNPLAVLPTGTGKSIIIARLCQVVTSSPHNRVLVLTHSSELVKQDAAKISTLCQDISRGIYSAGLGLKDTGQQVITGTVQSVFKALKRKTAAFGKRQLVIIDEAHLLSDKDSSMYRTTLDKLRGICPGLQVIGFSATPYRMDSGHLVEQDNAIFSKVSIDLTSSIPDFITAGYLAPLVMPPVPVKIELGAGCITAGSIDKKTNSYRPPRINDAKVEKILGNEALLAKACDAMVEAAADRRAWLVFVTGILNAGVVTDMLNQRGISAAAVNSSMSKEQNDKAIRDFRDGKLRCLVSANQLTTGFDVPQVDMIGMLRPTLSTSLHVQMLGRGLRPALNKDDCMVMDFAENLRRLGPINDPVLPEPPGEKAEKPAETEVLDSPLACEEGTEITCKVCGAVYVSSLKRCPVCHSIQPQEFDLLDYASNEAIRYDISTQSELPYGMYKVLNMVVQPHKSQAGSSCLRITVVCERRTTGKPFNSFFYLSFDKRGEPFMRACTLWEQFSGAQPLPQSTNEAMSRVSELKRPRAIAVVKGRFNSPQKYDQLNGVLY